MNVFQLVLAVDAMNDIDLPTASSIRYDQVRVKPVDTFPFAIHYNITVSQIIILRVFNTHQKPV